MARQETIEVKLQKAKEYDSTVKSLQDEADKLKATFESIKVGDSVKAIKEQAKAVEVAAKATAEKEKADQAALKTIALESKALQENEKYLQQKAKTEQEAARRTQETAKAARERSRAEKEAQNVVTARLKTEKEAANALTAESKMMREASKASQERAKAEKQNAAEIEKAYKQIQAAQEQAFSGRGNTAFQNTIDGLVGITRETKNAEESMRVFQRSGFFDELKKDAQGMRELEQESKRQEAALRRMGDAMGFVDAAQAQNIDKMRQYIQSINGMEKAQVTATGALHNAAGDFQTYNAAVAEAGGVTHNYRFAVDEATGDVYELDKGIKSTVVSVRDLSGVLRAVRTLVGFTGITQSLRFALSEMKDMSDEMAIYRKVTNATAEDMERIRAQAYATAKQYGQSASDVIASAANMGRAGYKQNSMAMAELATRTQLVGDMTADAASKFLIAVDAAYKYKGNIEELSKVLDGINEVDNNYATSIEKISEGMTLVASLGASAHVPIEQLTAALGTMSAVTQRSGSEVARGLRSIILNVMGDTSTEIEEGVTATEESVKSMTGALMRYGDESVKASIKAGKMINPMEAIVALQKAWKDNQISEADLFQISNDVAGKRYYNVFTALIQNPEMYNEMLQSIAQSTGSAQREIDALMDSWSKKLERLKTTWTELVNNSINEGYIKNLIDGTTYVLEFAGSLENLASMAGGALFVIRSLSAGIKNLRQPGALMNLDTFGRFNLATGIAGIGVAAYGIIKSAYEANQRALQEAAEKAVESAVASTTTYTSLEGLTRRYDEIAKDGIQEEKGELAELKTLQDKLNGLVGDQATAIDIVNGKYGETIKALQEITKKQRQATEESLRVALTTAIANTKGRAVTGNGISEFLTNRGDGISAANVTLDAYSNSAVQNWINSSNYLKVYGDVWDLFENRLYFKNPSSESPEEMIAFMEEVVSFYNFLGSVTENGTAAQPGEKTIGEQYHQMFTEFGKFKDAVVEIYTPVKNAKEAIDNYNKSLEELGGGSGSGSGSGNGSAGGASDAINNLAESVHTLTDSIKKATDAKKKFDDAMKTSKADAFKDYMEAFDTFKQELDAGRVNSTAMYAAARMMLGKEAYNATGGTYAGVMQAMYNRGSAGTVLDAYQMLNTEYVDKQGRTIEGFGAYELLRRSGVFGEGELTDANGNIFIPELTDAQYEQISAAYGGILVEVIMNALNALDQYDTKGAATDASTAPEVQKPNEEENNANEDTTKSTEGLGESAKGASESVDGFSETVEEEKKKIEGDGTSERAAQSAAYADAQTRKEQEEAKAAADAAEADRLQKQREILETAQEAYKAVDQVVERLSSINAMEANPVLANIVSNLEYLEKAHQIDIQTGNGTKVTEETIQAIQWAIQQITEGKNEGTIDVGLANNAIDVLTEQLHTAVSAMERNAGDADVEVGVSADTREAENDLDDLAEQKRETTITAELGGKDKFESDVSELTQKETKFIEVTDNGTVQDTKASASEVETALENVIAKLSAINATEPDPDILKMIDGLNGIKEKYTVDIQSGENTASAETTIANLASSLKIIDEKKNAGTINVELLTTADDLVSAINTVIATVESDETLDDIVLLLTADGRPLDAGIQEAIDQQREKIKLGVTADTTEAVNALNNLEDEPRQATIHADADTEQASADLDETAKDRPAYITPELKNAVPVAKTLELLANPTDDGRTAEINVIAKKVAEFKNVILDLTKTASKVIEIEYKDPNHPSNTAETKGNGSSALDYFGTGAGGGTMNALSTSISPDSTYLDRFGVTRHATGTRYHNGGISLVNDGNGPELLVSGGRAFIANGGRPALVNLQRGAKVFTASETRSILGGGVPAYADGVGNYGAIYGPALPGDIITKADYDAAKALAEETANGTGSEAQKEAKAFSDLKDLIDYIINRVGMALEEQTGIIDQQIAELRAQREAGEQQNELEERQKAVAEAQKDMIDALNERTVRYLGEDGKWHWMADARNVQTATEALEKANQALLDYEDEMAFDAQIDALEAQKTALEDEYKKITKAWEDIQYGVNTPTGDLASLIAEIIATGSATDKKGAQTVQSLLIGQLLQGGIFKGNYSEALDSIAKATGGNPIMPGESTATLASLIATTAAMGTGTEVTDAMKAANMGVIQGGAYSGVTGGGTQTNFNYFINGIQLGSDQAGQPLSEIMRNLTVYTNTGVA